MFFEDLPGSLIALVYVRSREKKPWHLRRLTNLSLTARNIFLGFWQCIGEKCRRFCCTCAQCRRLKRRPWTACSGTLWLTTFLPGTGRWRGTFLPVCSSHPYCTAYPSCLIYPCCTVYLSCMIYPSCVIYPSCINNPSEMSHACLCDSSLAVMIRPSCLNHPSCMIPAWVITTAYCMIYTFCVFYPSCMTCSSILHDSYILNDLYMLLHDTSIMHDLPILHDLSLPHDSSNENDRSLLNDSYVLHDSSLLHDNSLSHDFHPSCMIHPFCTTHPSCRIRLSSKMHPPASVWFIPLHDSPSCMINSFCTIHPIQLNNLFTNVKISYDPAYPVRLIPNVQFSKIHSTVACVIILSCLIQYDKSLDHYLSLPACTIHPYLFQSFIRIQYCTWLALFS